MTRRVSFTTDALDQFRYWARRDKKRWEKINELIDSACRTPFDGIGHPEALKADLHGYFSRRIAEDDRLVYGVSDDEITIISCRYHYDRISLPDD